MMQPPLSAYLSGQWYLTLLQSGIAFKLLKQQGEVMHVTKLCLLALGLHVIPVHIH